jgi:hypothetical protein
MATKADLEKRLEAFESIDTETFALQQVIDAIKPFAPRYNNDRVTREKRVKMARILAQAAERFDLPVYSDA